MMTVMAIVVTMSGSGSATEDEGAWALYRETVIPREERLLLKYPLFTVRKTRHDCLRRLYAELATALQRSLPPDRRVEGIEAKQERPTTWVYRLVGSGGAVLYELRLSCRADSPEGREKTE